MPTSHAPRAPRLLAALTLLAACDSQTEPTEPFDPTGNAAELYGEWDINGKVPDDDVCERAGIDSVEVEFSSADGSERFASDAFRWPCGPGYFDSPAPMLRAGAYAYTWHALSGGERVRSSREYPVTVRAGVEVELMPVDFLRRHDVGIHVALSYETNAMEPGTCATAFVDATSWELRRDTSLGAVIASSNGEVGCLDALEIPDRPVGLLAEGEYVLVVYGSAIDGAMWDGECPVTVLESGRVEVGCEVVRGM